MTATGPFTELNSRRMGPVRRFFVRRPRTMDALVMIFVALAVSTSDVGTVSTRQVPVAVAFGILSGLALGWRRSHPLAVTGATVALGVVSLAATGSLGGIELPLAFALYAVAVSLPGNRAWMTASVAVALTVGAEWLWADASPDPIERAADGSVIMMDDRVATTAGVLILVLAGMAFGTSVRNRREYLASLLSRANALATDRDRQAQLARAAERSRIAREMHDVVAHSLSVMITLADGASASLVKAPDRSQAALRELASTGRAALGDMRRVLGALHDDAPLEPTGQVQDLPALIERFRTAGLPVRAEGLQLDPQSDTGVRLALYRVVQEALTNVLRHARGTARVDVDLRDFPDHWEATVTDYGGVAPVDDAGGSGLGLVGMRERVGLLGGSVEAGQWELGWRVHVVIPHQEAEQ